MAEGVFAHMVRRAGLDNSISVDSCGTAEWYVGDPPHPGTLRVLAEHDIPFEHRGRQLSISDLDADYLIPMDSDNLAGIQALGQAQGEVKRLLDYVPEIDLRDMPDPWYTGRFDETYDLVQRGCVKLLENIRQAEGLA